MNRFARFQADAARHDERDKLLLCDAWIDETRPLDEGTGFEVLINQ